MTILTPTFKEQNGNGTAKRRPGRPRITPVHEPLPGEPLPEMPAMPAPPPFTQLQPAVTAAPQPLKVACIGTAPSSRMLAPYNDPSWKIWACSPGNQNVLPRVDVWFEIHGNLMWPENESYGKTYIEFLRHLKIPVYMQDNSLVPTAIPVPMRDMVREFGPYHFTSSFSWMMALAITQGAKEIALYGIDMASRDEYILQRQGGQYFIVEGARRGVKIWAPHESDIMQPPGLYGYSDVGPLGRKILARDKEIRDRIGPMRQQRDHLHDQIRYLEGALEDVDYFKSIHLGAQDNSNASEWLNSLIEKARNQPNGQG